ncbi:hypothetical protein H4S08_004609 [Coemansia sp. RSA 1365]|nr:hypothetical protein H4S08_004609 [Coemansia sp. RSA 1365]
MRLRTAASVLGPVDNYSAPKSIYGLFIVVAVAIFILECQPKPDELFELPEDDYSDPIECGIDENACLSVDERANIFSKLGILWMTPLVEKGYCRPLQFEDTWKLGRQYRPTVAITEFEKHWNVQLESKSPSLFWASVQSYWHYWTLSGFLKLTGDLLNFLRPILLSRLLGFAITYNTSKGEPIQNGYFYAVSLYVVITAQTLISHQRDALNQLFRSQMTISYMTAVYRKYMVLSPNSRQKFGTGSIVNRMDVDINSFIYFVTESSHNLWSNPFQVIIALYLLYQTLGWTIIAGVGAMFFSFAITACLSPITGNLYGKLMIYRDQRLELMNEVLSGIRVIKLYAWESSFIKRINHVRVELELANIRINGMVNAFFFFITDTIGFSITFFTFALYSLVDNQSHGSLNPQLIFVSMSLFGMLSLPIGGISGVVNRFFQMKIAFLRFYELLIAEEIDFTAIKREPYDDSVSSANTVLVSVKDSSFKWLSKNECTLNDINLECKRGELVAVVGKVGSGKSSLISAILGDMVKCSGSVTICGSVAYVPQQPWILNTTLRENIIFGHRYDKEFFNEVIDACALRPDVEMLPAADMTEIGEKGVTLSGGQKMRVSLARAIYSQADVYFLDDPLAAVDAHVSKHIFTHVLGPQGILKSRTRILVTNALKYLSSMDHIIMLHDGKIVEDAPFELAIANRGHIFKFSNRSMEEQELKTSSSSSSIISSSPDTIYTESSNDKQKSSLIADATDLVHNEPGPIIISDAGRTISVETKREGEVGWDVYRSYVDIVGVQNFVLYLITLLAATLGSICTNVWIKHWSNSNLSAHDTVHVSEPANHSVVYYLLIYGAIAIISALFNSMQSLVMRSKCSISASTKLHRNMLAGVMRAPVSFFDVTPLGRIINRFSVDLSCCDDMLPNSVSGVTSNIAAVLTTFGVIVVSMPPMLLLMIPLSFAYLYLQRRYLYSSRELERISSMMNSPVLAHFQEITDGVSTICAYGQQSRFMLESQRRLAQKMRSNISYNSLLRWLTLRLEFLGNTVTLGTCIWAIISLQYFGFNDAGLLGLVITYSLNVMGSLNWSIRDYTELENCMTHLERIVEYTNLTPEAPTVIEDNRPKKEWPEQGLVEFKNFSMRYREGLDLVLKDVSFRVLPRQKVGIVGRTGAGKSSMTLALFRIVEAAGGQILLDGEDILQYGLFDVRSKLAVIPQDPLLFAGTLRENLDPLNNYTDQDIWRALEQAHLAEYIRSKDDRLEFVVTHKGDNFSVGQKQLICLARALLKQAKVLMLDEATAAIDIATDSIIQSTIRNEFKNCTVLTIAHRLETITDSDMILVIDAGRLAEYDTPQNLLANKNSLFAKLLEESHNH